MTTNFQIFCSRFEAKSLACISTVFYVSRARFLSLFPEVRKSSSFKVLPVLNCCQHLSGFEHKTAKTTGFGTTDVTHLYLNLRVIRLTMRENMFLCSLAEFTLLN